MKVRIHLCLLVVSVIVIMAPCVASAAPFDSAIAPNAAFRGAPTAAGGRAAWAAQPMVGDWDLSVYNFQTQRTTQIDTTTADQVEPSLGNNYLVWADNRNGNFDIYIRNLPYRRTTRLTKSLDEQRNPDVSGKLVVWEQKQGSANVVKFMDLRTKKTTRVTLNGLMPSIAGNRIAYLGADGGRIYVYNTRTKSAMRIASIEDTVTDLELSGKWVVWSEVSGVTTRTVTVKAHDLIARTTKMLMSSTATGAAALSVDGVTANGTLIAFAIREPGPTDHMYVYDTQSRVITALADSAGMHPALSGDRLVYLARTPMPKLWSHWLNRPTISLTGATLVTKYKTVTLSGSAIVKRDSTPLASRKLKVQRSYDGWIWTNVGTVTTNPVGKYTVKTPKIAQRQYFRIVSPGTVPFSALSPSLYVKLK